MNAYTHYFFSFSYCPFHAVNVNHPVHTMAWALGRVKGKWEKGLGGWEVYIFRVKCFHVELHLLSKRFYLEYKSVVGLKIMNCLLLLLLFKNSNSNDKWQSLCDTCHKTIYLIFCWIINKTNYLWNIQPWWLGCRVLAL